MKYTFSLLPIALLVACSGHTPPPTTALADMPELSLRATGDIEIPATIVDAAFVPNPIASWASQIIMISDEGDIWRTNTDAEQPLLIAKGDYQDIQGLVRENGAGVFLGAQPDGRASAFIERDDIGNFKPMTVSQGAFGIKAFCNGGGAKFGFIDLEDKIQILTTTFVDDISIELGANGLPQLPATPVACSFNADGDVFVTTEHKTKLHTYRLKDKTWESYDGDITTRNLTWLEVEGTELGLGLSPESTTVSLLTGGKVNRLSIEDGLSIRGLQATSFVSGTNAPMGSAYNEGVILMGDANKDRIVMLSLDYVGRVLITYTENDQ